MDPTAEPIHWMAPLEWRDLIAPASRAGMLHTVLGGPRLPRERWQERDQDGHTLLHYAGWGSNVAAAKTLVLHGISPESRNHRGWRPIHDAVYHGQADVVEVLCAVGADLHAGVLSANNALDLALRCSSRVPGARLCARVLVANGLRLDTVRTADADATVPGIVALDRGVLHCRAVAVVLLGLKRRRSHAMRALDRWVVREVTIECWTTRMHPSWQ